MQLHNVYWFTDWGNPWALKNPVLVLYPVCIFAKNSYTIPNHVTFKWKGEKDIISLLGDDMFHQIFAHLRNDGGDVSLLRRRYFYQHVIEQQLMTSRINLISPHHMLQVRIVNIKFWAAGLITAPYFHLSPANCSFKGRGCHICGLCTPS